MKIVIAGYIKKRIRALKTACKDKSVRAQIDNAFDKVGQWFHDKFLWVHGKRFVSKIEKEAKKLYDLLTIKTKRGNFSYCQCSMFINYHKSSQERNEKYQTLNNLYRKKCQ